jgi:succinoglycan biosynthesis protein ExoL
MLAHDLADDSVHKRVAMLRAGGADVTVAGFRRAPEPIRDVAGIEPIDFGRTRNGAFGQRVWSVCRELASFRRQRARFSQTDVIVARSLEMLAIAAGIQRTCKSRPAIVYESLDIHRLLLRPDPIGTLLRSIEGLLSNRVSALATSSPGFISNYFEPRSKVNAPIWLLENKVFPADGLPNAAILAPRQAGPPWIIGWFGHIRCATSLSILAQLVRRNPGAIEVVIRGRPALDQFADFHGLVRQTRGLRFEGPYKNPDDLGAMYRNVHFTWAIDLYERGLNSAWLLPNRLYEGGLLGSVPIADASVETGRFLQRVGVGVTLPQPLSSSLAAFFRDLTPERYAVLEAAALHVPKATWAFSNEDCIELVRRLASLTSAADCAASQGR